MTSHRSYSFRPDGVEDLVYSHYMTPRVRASNLISDLDIRAPDEMECPRCATPRNGINHGELVTVCENCTLRMQVFGNCLRIWQEGETPEFKLHPPALRLVPNGSPGKRRSYPGLFTRLYYAVFKPEKFRV